MKGKVDSVTRSKSGKTWRVKIGDTFYGANFDTKLDGAIGKNIDFKFNDGDFGPWIESWGYDTAVPAPAPSSASASHLNGDRFYMPFVSNTVAHGIAAGLIKNPADLNVWARAAHDVAVALDAL